MLINDLAVGVKELHCGIDIGNVGISLLLYADDIVLLAPSEEMLQTQLNFVSDWCTKWKMSVNEEKTQVMHFKPRRYARSNFQWCYGNNQLETVKTYKYLGVMLHEHMDFSIAANSLSGAGSRAMGALRYKLKSPRECRYTKLYITCICHIIDYSAGIWGFKNYAEPKMVQRRAIRFYLGVYRHATNCVVEG